MDSPKSEMEVTFEKARIRTLSPDELQAEYKAALGEMFKENIEKLIMKDMEKNKNVQHT